MLMLVILLEKPSGSDEMLKRKSRGPLREILGKLEKRATERSTSSSTGTMHIAHSKQLDVDSGV